MATVSRAWPYRVSVRTLTLPSGKLYRIALSIKLAAIRSVRSGVALHGGVAERDVQP